MSHYEIAHSLRLSLCRQVNARLKELKAQHAPTGNLAIGFYEAPAYGRTETINCLTFAGTFASVDNYQTFSDLSLEAISSVLDRLKEGQYTIS